MIFLAKVIEKTSLLKFLTNSTNGVVPRCARGMERIRGRCWLEQAVVALVSESMRMLTDPLQQPEDPDRQMLIVRLLSIARALLQRTIGS